jgi:hypothetical protein
VAQDWDIRPRGNACARCGQPFADGAACFSALAHGAAGYSRADFCAPCWNDGAAAPDAFSAWQGTYHAPPPPTEPPLRKETAESLLRRLLEDTDERRGGVVYVLAVMLERNRTLVEREVKLEDGAPALRVYEHRSTGETFLIPDPRLRLDELEQVEHDTAALLGWNQNRTVSD